MVGGLSRAGSKTDGHSLCEIVEAVSFQHPLENTPSRERTHWIGNSHFREGPAIPLKAVDIAGYNQGSTSLRFTRLSSPHNEVSEELLMFTRFLSSGSLAIALLLSSAAVQPLYAQHHGGGHHGGGGGGGMHHSGGTHHGGGSFGGGGSSFGGGGSSYGGGSHHHHSGGGLYLGGSGFGLGYGSGYYGGYGGYGNGYNSLRYSSGYGGYNNGYYNSYPSYNSGYYSNYGSNVYVTPRYVTPTYVTPSQGYYPSSSSAIIYQSPSVQPSPVDSTQRTNLPGVSFGGRAHIPELATAVADRANQLCLALHDSYSGNSQFNEVYRDTYALITNAKQLAQANGDAPTTMGIVSELNAILTNVTPAIERFTPTVGGSSASAASHLSSVTSAIKLLSVDAGWDASQAVSSPAGSAVAPQITPAPAVAPAPEPAPTPAAAGDAAATTPATGNELPVPVP